MSNDKKSIILGKWKCPICGAKYDGILSKNSLFVKLHLEQHKKKEE